MARVTLKQLAEELNLSTTTVSDVVRGKGTSRVSDQTRGRILAAAGQLGYRSNRLSRALRTQRSQIIGMLSSGLPAVSTSRERFAALERSLAAHDYVASFALHHSEEAALGRALDAFQDLCVGAIVTDWVDTPLETLLAAWLKGAGIPVVSFGPLSEVDCHYVGTDYAVGGRLVVEHLFRQGCRRFAFVHQTLRGLNLLPLEQRVAGYRAAYEDSIGPWDDAPVIVVPYKGDVASVGLIGAETLLETGQELDAIVCANDRIALGLIKGLRRGGIDPVKANIRIAGFDDAPFVRHLDVPLVTIRQPVGEVARIAAEIVLDLVQGRTPSHPKHVSLPPALVDWADETEKARSSDEIT